MLKKLIIAIIVIFGAVYLYLVLAVNTKKKELQEFKEQVKQDSIDYHSKETDSNKATH